MGPFSMFRAFSFGFEPPQVKALTLEGITAHVAAICLVVLSMAGALRVVFGLGYGLYYGAVGGLGAVAGIRCVLALRTNGWRVTPFSGVVSGLGLERRVVLYVLLYCAFFLWLLLTTLWTHAPEAMWKEDFLYICVLLCVLVLTGFSMTRDTAGKVLMYWVAGAVTVGVYVIMTTMGASTQKDYRALFFTRGIGWVTLPLATAQGVALVTSFCHFLVGQVKARKLLWLGLMALFVAGLGRSLGRGSLLFALFGMLVVLVGTFWHDRGPLVAKIKRMGTYGLVCGVVGFGLFYGAMQVEYFAQRLGGFTDTSAKHWPKARITGWEKAWEAGLEAPVFGRGLGMNAAVAAPRPYPHNLFLQVWIDGGGVAVLGLAGLLGWPMVLFLKRFKDKYNDPVFLSLFAVLLILLLEFSKSYDFYTAISLVVVSVLSMKHLGQDSCRCQEGGS